MKSPFVIVSKCQVHTWCILYKIYVCVHVFFVRVFYHCILTTRFAGMGNLLKVLTREIENYPHFFLDFESKSGRGEEQGRKRWMEKEMWGGGGGGVTGSAVSFLSAGLWSRWHSCAGALLMLCFFFSPLLILPLSHDLLLFQLWSHVSFFDDYLTSHILFFPSLSFFPLSCRNQMGNLLKVLTCTELEQGPNFFLDFESERSLCLSFCLTSPLLQTSNSFSL